LLSGFDVTRAQCPQPQGMGVQLANLQFSMWDCNAA